MSFIVLNCSPSRCPSRIERARRSWREAKKEETNPLSDGELCAPPSLAKAHRQQQQQKKRNEEKERHPLFFSFFFTFPLRVRAIVMAPFRIVSSRHVSGDGRFASVEQVFDFLSRVVPSVVILLLLLRSSAVCTVDLFCWCWCCCRRRRISGGWKWCDLCVGIEPWHSDDLRSKSSLQLVLLLYPPPPRPRRSPFSKSVYLYAHTSRDTSKYRDSCSIWPTRVIDVVASEWTNECVCVSVCVCV